MSVSPEQPSPPTPAPLPQAPALPDVGTPESTSYQPLSLLALASFILALGFAVPVVLGAAVAFFTRTPLLLPPWMLLGVVVILLLAWVARLQIQSAEGTRSGLFLTRWAVILCLVLGPLYAAYYCATYFAVTAQAEHVAREYLKRLAEGDLEKAFWMTVDPVKRSGAQTRENLEVNYNQPDGQGRAPFTNFRASELVHLLSNAGKEPTIDLVGINDWSYEKAGYRVVALYKIATTLATFNAVVTTQGATGPGGRVWYVLERATGRATDTQPALTPEGERLSRAAAPVHALVETLAQVGTGVEPEDLFLKALPAAEARVVSARQGGVIVRGLLSGLFPPSNATARQVLAARQRWFGGDIFVADPVRFWTSKDPKTRAGILAAVRRVLTQGVPPGGRILAPPRLLPMRVPAEGMELMGYDVSIILPRGETHGASDLVVDALVVVRVKTDARGQPEADGIERIELISGRSMLVQAPPPGRRP